MSIYAVERVRQIMDGYVTQGVAPLIVNTEATERVESWLADDECRQAYRRELAFMVLVGLMRDNRLLNNLVGNVKESEWQKALAKVSELRAAGAIPEFEFAPSPDGVSPDIFASIYVMEQYVHGDEVSPSGVFLDCGGWCGETAVWAIGRGARRVYSFEPDPVAFTCLRRNANRLGRGRIVAVQCGLGMAPALMPIRQGAGGLGDTRLDPRTNGDSSVQIVTLDNWCSENRIAPDFIKMDLGGWELPALRGARAVISVAKPRLAVCLYHNLSDMWTIPHFIKEICPSYRFWCRKNAPSAEFVLYAACPA
ncbi:MAG: FkbM family methyltransferase [Planctomycetes bacterium]|nr:FkbM family methyltransferase [Planctomycetota bacterium]